MTVVTILDMQMCGYCTVNGMLFYVLRGLLFTKHLKTKASIEQQLLLKSLKYFCINHSYPTNTQESRTTQPQGLPSRPYKRVILVTSFS